MAKDPFRYFRVEARELLDQLGKGVLELERSGSTPEPDLVLRILRWAHTLKGAARVVKQSEIANLIHGVEDVLAPLRDPSAPLARQQIDAALAALDRINALLSALPQPEAPATPAARAAEVPLRVGRADAVEVDLLLEGLGEIGSELAELRHSMACLGELRASTATDELGRRQDSQLRALERALAGSAERIDRELRQSRDAAERLRLTPVASLFHALDRAARDAAHSMNKQVTFEARGGDLRIDGEVLDLMQGALLQLVRNAVAHGIEGSAQRSAAGKPPAGKVALEVQRRGYRAWFRCSDDGAGVDLAAVRRAAAGHGDKAGRERCVWRRVHMREVAQQFTESVG